MTYKEVKELLNTYLSKLRLLKLKKEQLSIKREEFREISAIDYSKESVQGGTKTSVQDRYMLSIYNYEKEVERLMNELFDIEDKIAEFMPLLNATEQTLVIERYMNCKPMCVIARNYHYSYERLRHKYCEINQKLSKNWKSTHCSTNKDL